MNEAASISVLPEDCLTEILSVTSPRDTCRAATISKEFNSTYGSNSVWDWFLLLDYSDIIAREVSHLVFGFK